MCSRVSVAKEADHITEVCQRIANDNVAKLLDTIGDDRSVTTLQTAYISYVDAFQSAFRKQVAAAQKCDSNHEDHDLEQLPWLTEYVTLRPINGFSDNGYKAHGSSLVAKAQKITKKACNVLLTSNNHHDSSSSSSPDGILGSIRQPALVELYAHCVKEGPIEWTRPEKASEEAATKNIWRKAKLRLLFISGGAVIEATTSKQSNKPAWGCFASTMREIRSTSSLETPEEDNNFVIRTTDKEYLIRVGSSVEKTSWLLMIRRLCSFHELRYYLSDY